VPRGPSLNPAERRMAVHVEDHPLDYFDFEGVIPKGEYGGGDVIVWDWGTFEPEERVLANVSDGSAYVTGIEIEGWCHLARLWDRLPEGLSLHGGFAYNYGNDRTRDEPLRHVHPPYAVLDLRYESPTGRWWVEFGAMIVGEADRIPSDRIASDPGFRRNPQDITSPLLRPDGSLPGYTVFDLRGGYEISDRARVEVAIENLTDKKYRSLHSRMDSPGFGVRVGFTWDF